MKPKYITVGIITSILLCYVYDLMTKHNSSTPTNIYELELEEE